MTTVETYVAELEGKNQTSFDRLLAAHRELVETERLSLADLLRLEVKTCLESMEASAMWLTDTDDLPFKVALAAYCGASAQRFALLQQRLGDLNVHLADFSPLCLGYSKLFAFFRSLQTVEERAAAGALTAGAYTLARFDSLAGWAELAGDHESAALLRSALPATEQENVHEGRLALLGVAKNEESQARARRASFRTIELLTELQDPNLVRKFLSKSLRKPQTT
ncbi:MAG: hypothetical protein SF187_00645 [Deltaproteobacteria bacterium]|nr:hypothetical protein [Deltaproteobacteria bacterium]